MPVGDSHSMWLTTCCGILIRHTNRDKIRKQIMLSHYLKKYSSIRSIWILERLCFLVELLEHEVFPLKFMFSVIVCLLGWETCWTGFSSKPAITNTEIICIFLLQHLFILAVFGFHLKVSDLDDIDLTVENESVELLFLGPNVLDNLFSSLMFFIIYLGNTPSFFLFFFLAFTISNLVRSFWFFSQFLRCPWSLDSYST